MAAKGIVKTATGATLNMAELIDAANQPRRAKQPGSEVKLREAPKRRALNVRGNQPALHEEPSEAAHAAMRGETVQVIEPKAPISSFTGEPVATMADLTGIKVDMDKSKVKRKGVSGSEEALNEILTDLKATTRDASGYKGDDLSS